MPAPVLRANGKHRAVAVPAGKHEVVLRYEPPGLAAGIGLSARLPRWSRRSLWGGGARGEAGG